MQASRDCGERMDTAMSEPKTKPTGASVSDFLNAVADEQRRADCKALAKLMKKVTGFEPKMWGESIVGYGQYHYRGKSGREGDWPLTGFSPRKQALTVYLMSGLDSHEALLGRLGKFTRGKGCLYIKRLSDVDTDVLGQLIEESLRRMAEMNRQGQI